MAVDETLPKGTPGLANFESRTYGNEQSHIYSDTPPVATITMDFTASGADLEISWLDVLALDGDAAVYNATPSAATANVIAATSITIADGETKSVPVYVTGHFTMDALGWDASYDTDAKKKAAFQGSQNPTILVSKAKFNSDAVYP